MLGVLFALLTVLILYRLIIVPGLLASRREKQFAVMTGQAGTTGAETPRAPKTLRGRLLAAGVNLGEEAELVFYLMSATFAVLAAALAFFLGLPLLIALLAGAAGFMLPRVWLSGQEKKRAREIDAELPGALGDLVAILRVQPDVFEALRQTAEILDAGGGKKSHLAQEFRWTVEDRAALGIEKALKALEERSPSDALASLAFTLSVYARTGGQFIKPLEAQAHAIRETLEARNAARAEGADAMLSAKAVPILLALVLIGLMQDPRFGAFYRSFAGQVILLFGIAAMAAGYWMMQCMVEEVA